MRLAWWIAGAIVAAFQPPPAAAAPKGPAAAPVARGDAPADVPDTLMEALKVTSFPLGDWTYLADSADGIVFYRHPIQRQAGLPRITTRWEFAKPRSNSAGRYLSLRFVQDVDCIRGLSHAVEREAHMRHNLEGPVLIETLADEPWIAPDEGSLKQVVFRKACAPR